MLVDGIIDSLKDLNLSKNELSQLEDTFDLYIGKIYGSWELAEQSFDNDPKAFADKYLELFCMIKKEIISSRRHQK